VKLSTEANRAAYGASRVAVAGLTQLAAAELGLHNVHIHALTFGVPQFHNVNQVYTDPLQAVFDLCGEKFATENGKIINIG
jgi:NAD(P)-dependent dehydrogenase (short-subunit alcohol dehydrogenase family)